LPAIDTQHGKKAPSRRRLTAPTPDQQDRTASPGRQRHRARRVEQAVNVAARAERRRRVSDRVTTPDQRDRTRPRVQRQLDADAVAQVVRQARMDVLGKRGRGKGWPTLAHLIVVPEKEGKKQPTLKGTSIAATRPRSEAGFAPNLNRNPIARAVVGTAWGIAKDPKVAIPKTVSGFKDMALGIPGAGVKIGSDVIHHGPVKAAKNVVHETAKDGKRRYGGITKPGGMERMANRVAKEGAAPEITDFLSVGVPASRLVDAALGTAAKRGALGPAAQRVMTTERPRMRTSGGASKAQPLPRGLARAQLAHRRDTRARTTVARDVATGLARGAALAESGTGEKKGFVNAVVREAHDRGEVVPTRRLTAGRQVATGKINRAQRRANAETRTKHHHQQRAETQREVNRGINRNISGLNRWEKRGFKTAIELGVRTPEAARAAIKRRLAIIDRHRVAGEDIPTEVDEVPVLKAIHDNAERVFTERLGRVADQEVARGARTGIDDPSLGQTATKRTKAATVRRYAKQATVLARERKGTPITEALRTAKATERRAGARVTAAERATTRAEKSAARSEGAAGSEARRVVGQIQKQIDRAETVAAKHEAAAAKHRKAIPGARSPERKAQLRELEQKAASRAQAARERAAQLERNKAAVQPGYRRNVQQARGEASDRAKRAEELRGERATATQTRKQVKRQKKAGRETIYHEKDITHQKAVRRARADANKATGGGFVEPGYYPSRRRTSIRRAVYTLGGARAVKPDARYKGKLFKAGRETHDPTVYSQAIAQNIKRKHNWAYVGDTIDNHAFEWGKGLTYKKAMDEIGARGIDPDSVRILDMDALDNAARRSDSEGGMLVGETDSLHDALKTGTHKADPTITPTRGKVVVLPKAVADEIISDTHPSNFIGRSWDIAKGKASRLLLGTSPAWLAFQVASNAALTGLAGAGPVSLAKSIAWWHSLSQAEKDAIEPYIGTGAFHGDAQTPMIGAASNADVVNAYRAFKSTPFFHKPRKVLGGTSVRQWNPLDALFRVDNMQNNLFRKAVLYNRISRDTYRKLGDEVGTMQALQERIMRIAKLPPEKQIKELVNNREAVESYAKSVNDFLGDFSTYTAAQRRYFQRYVMFGGFLRFSLRLAFKTMPIEHPLMTGIMGRLGQLQSEETRKLLGGDALPWQLGKYYWNDDGTLKSINVGRLNPFLNQVTNISGIKDLGGVLPPFAQAALNQIYGTSMFTGKQFQVRGGKDSKGMTLGDRGRILLEQALGSTIAPYREWSKATAEGRPMGDDDSLLLSLLGGQRRPTVSKDADTQLGVERSVKRWRAQHGSPAKAAIEALVEPWKGQPDPVLERARLRKLYKDKEALQAKIDAVPERKRGGEFFNSQLVDDLNAQMKALNKRIDEAQALGKPAPEPHRRTQRPKPLDVQLQEKLDKLSSGDLGDELEKKLRRMQERNDIVYGTG
jgi:hypothetical protein